MSNQPVSAPPVLMTWLAPSLVDQKLRIAGRSLSYEQETQLLLIHDEANHACLVDTSLVLDAMLELPDLRDVKAIVTVIGYLERVKDNLPIPTIPEFIEAPAIDSSLVVRAILLTPSPDLDLVLWRKSIRQREAANVDS